MGNIEKVFLVLLVLDALALIGLVLLQQGKGADVGAAFGSGSSGTVFGSSGGANFLTRLTTFFAVLFFGLCETTTRPPKPPPGPSQCKTDCLQ